MRGGEKRGGKGEEGGRGQKKEERKGGGRWGEGRGREEGRGQAEREERGKEEMPPEVVGSGQDFAAAGSFPKLLEFSSPI